MGRNARSEAGEEDRPYHLRDFTNADPDGFGVRYASGLPGPAW
jgi:hypothetical protein